MPHAHVAHLWEVHQQAPGRAFLHLHATARRVPHGEAATSLMPPPLMLMVEAGVLDALLLEPRPRNLLPPSPSRDPCGGRSVGVRACRVQVHASIACSKEIEMPRSPGPHPPKWSAGQL